MAQKNVKLSGQISEKEFQELEKRLVTTLVMTLLDGLDGEKSQGAQDEGSTFGESTLEVPRCTRGHMRDGGAETRIISPTIHEYRYKF